MTKTKKKASKVVWCERGWQTMFFGFCPSKEAWDAQMKKMGITTEDYPTNDASVTFFNTKGGKHIALVTMPNPRKNRAEMTGLLVHEAVHIWQEVLDHMKEHSKPGYEIEAYAIQAIYQSLLWAMEKAGVIKL